MSGGKRRDLHWDSNRPGQSKRQHNQQAERLWNQMAELDGDTIVIAMERTGSAVGKDGFGRTFSAQAMEDVRDQMIMWVGTRVHRMAVEAEQSGTPLPQKLTIGITVTPETGWDVLDSATVNPG